MNDLLDRPVHRLPIDVLREVFGYDSFRGQQAEIIDHVIAGNDALVLMPTGGGKSLCYQVPALCRPGTAVVVSPLIALMKDQVDALNQLGVKAAFINSTLSPEAAREIVLMAILIFCTLHRNALPPTAFSICLIASAYRCLQLMKPIAFHNGGMIFGRNTAD